MNSIFQPNNLTETLGWTLLNSVWQGLLLWMIVIIALQLIPNKLSKVRYTLAVGSIIIFLITNVVTFSFLSTEHPAVKFTQHPVSTKNFASQQILTFPLQQPIIEQTINQVSHIMPYVIVCWIMGSILFMLRLASGWWYVNRLKSTATPLEEWSEQLVKIAQQLNIRRLIRVAESNNISTPMVIGFIKPMILIPTGLISGLSTDQVESIFIHELAHIRRHDFLVNFIQSIVESIYFFNPFLWMMSNIIRREREYCCDDAVVTMRGSSLAYVKALSQLEEMRLSSTMPAVGFAENKNQLLTRIKRIMEKSTKNYASMDRIVPALLLVIGLVCASWLTINSDKHVEQKRATIQTDTTKKKSASYSRSTIVTYDDNGKPHEQSVEEYTGDDDLRPLIAPLEIAEIVDFPLPPADVIEMQELEFPVAPMPGIFNIRFDTLPVPGVRFRNHQEVEEFGKAFQEKFREQFSDFYKSNEKEFQRMIEQLEEKFEKDIDEKDIFAWKDQAFSDAQQQKLTAEAERMQERLARDMSNDLLVQKIQAEKEMQHAQEMQRESFKAMEMSMADEQEHMKMMQSEMKLLKEKLQLFEKELKTELVKDGYIKQGEKIDNINWEDRGDSMEVNGQKIKPEHRDKYKSLHRKYFNAATHISE